MHMYVCVQVREYTSHLEAELEKHMAAAGAECQSYAKEVAGVSLPAGSLPAQSRSSAAALVNMSSESQFSGFCPRPWASHPEEGSWGRFQKGSQPTGQG